MVKGEDILKGRLALVQILPWIRIRRRLDSGTFSQILLEDALASSRFSGFKVKVGYIEDNSTLLEFKGDSPEKSLKIVTSESTILWEGDPKLLGMALDLLVLKEGGDLSKLMPLSGGFKEFTESSRVYSKESEDELIEVRVTYDLMGDTPVMTIESPDGPSLLSLIESDFEIKEGYIEFTHNGFRFTVIKKDLDYIISLFPQEE